MSNLLFHFPNTKMHVNALNTPFWYNKIAPLRVNHKVNFTKHKPKNLSIINSSEKSVNVADCFQGSSQQESANTEEIKFKKLVQAKEKVTKLHFYVQDALGGASATVWEVAESAITATSTASFGQVRVLDDVITAGPDRNSMKLGQAQGMISYTGLDEPALTMSLNFYFNNGEYSGSTLCVVGRNPINRKNRELPVVGGTGVFRMARGYSVTNTYSYDAVANYGVLEYTIYVAHVDEECLGDD